MIKKVAVLGRKGIEKYSLSPLIHNTFFKENGMEGEYRAISILPENLKIFLKELQDNNYTGVNLTIPHKVNVINFLDELDITAKTIGAVNTVFFKDGRMIGYNTDSFGFIKNLEAKIKDWRMNDKVLMIGAGGASRAALYGLKSNGIDDIVICNRTYERAVELAEKFNCSALHFKDINSSIGDRNFIVNTTSVGMDKNGLIDLNLEGMKGNTIVYDVVYTPLITQLLRTAKNFDLKIVDGLGMLLFQAAKSFEIWFGLYPKLSDELVNKCLKKLNENS